MVVLPIAALLGLGALAVWACLWFVLSGRAQARKKSSVFYFWQMSRWWSVINMAIVIFSAVLLWTQQSALTDPIQASSFWRIMRTIVNANIWMDVGYIAVGWILSAWKHRTQAVRLQGYGLAIMAQGAGLLVIDVALYNGLLGF